MLSGPLATTGQPEAPSVDVPFRSIPYAKELRLTSGNNVNLPLDETVRLTGTTAGGTDSFKEWCGDSPLHSFVTLSLLGT